MLDLDTAFLQKLGSDGVDDMFLLATIEVEGLPTLNLSFGARTITWGATVPQVTVDGTRPADRATYAAMDGSFNTRRDTLDSEPSLSSITVTNLDDAWYTRLHESGEEYNGGILTFKTVFASVDPADIVTSRRSRIEDGPYMLSGWAMSDEGVTFDFGTSFNALKLMVPTLLSRSRRCQHAYKGPYCRSTSGLPTCGKTPSECAERHNGALRFSAWPFSNREFF